MRELREPHPLSLFLNSAHHTRGIMILAPSLLLGLWSPTVPVTVVRRLGLMSRGWERKRFYKKVSVYKTEEGYGVLLDHRKLRTPSKEFLVLPTQPLGLAVAGEWASQGSLLQPSIMHLTALCNTVLDNPHPSSTSSTVETLISHLHTDTLLYRQKEQEDLFAMQIKEWDPVVTWFNQRFCCKLQPSTSLDLPSLPPSLLSTLSLYLSQLDNWTLQGFWYAVQSCQSVIITSALMEGHLNVDSAVNLSRLETLHQIGYWGKVEWQHDVEHQDLRSRLSASHLMALLANWTV